MSVKPPTKSKAKLERIAETRDLDAQAKAWAEKREEPVTATTWTRMPLPRCFLCHQPISYAQPDLLKVAGSRGEYVHAACGERHDAATWMEGKR